MPKLPKMISWVKQKVKVIFRKLSFSTTYHYHRHHTYDKAINRKENVKSVYAIGSKSDLSKTIRGRYV